MEPHLGVRTKNPPPPFSPSPFDGEGDRGVRFYPHPLVLDTLSDTFYFPSAEDGNILFRIANEDKWSPEVGLMVGFSGGLQHV